MTIQHTRAYQATGNVPTPLASVVVGLFIDKLWITRSLKSPLMRHSKLCASKYLSPNKNITRGITTSNDNTTHPSIPGYWKCAHTFGVSCCWPIYWQIMDYKVIEKSSNEAFQALCIEISFSEQKYNTWNHLPSTQLPWRFSDIFRRNYWTVSYD